MKKIIILILLALMISPTINAQTEKETQIWIKKKLEEYGNWETDTAIYKLEVSFKEDTVVFQQDYHLKRNTTRFFPRFYYLSLKDISSIEVYPRPYDAKINDIQYYGILFYSTLEKNLFRYEGKYAYKERWGERRSSNNNYVEIQLNPKILDNNLKDRIIKAFEHLIEINGGTIYKEDTF